MACYRKHHDRAYIAITERAEYRTDTKLICNPNRVSHGLSIGSLCELMNLKYSQRYWFPYWNCRSAKYVSVFCLTHNIWTWQLWRKGVDLHINIAYLFIQKDTVFVEMFFDAINREWSWSWVIHCDVPWVYAYTLLYQIVNFKWLRKRS